MMIFVAWAIACFLSTFGITFLFCKLNEIKKIPKKAIFIFLLAVIFQTVFKFYNIKYYTLVSFFIFYPIIFLSISNFNLKKTIVNTLVIWLVGIILDLMSMLFFTIICSFWNIDLEKNYLVFSILLTIVLSFIFLLVGIWGKSKNLLFKIVKFFCDIDYIDFTLAIFCIFIAILSITIFFDLERIKVDILMFAIIILSLLVFALLIKYKIDSVENKKYLETLKENNNFYIKMDDENRIFKHNLMAKLSSIKSVSNKKAIALIDDYVIKTNKTLSYSKKIKSIPYGINGIIYQRTYPYLEDINFRVTNKIDFDIFNVLKPRRYNVLVEKIVVSLDNAIEACLNSKNKVVVINLYDDEDNIYVEIKNSFSHDLDVDNLGNLNYSTKGRRRGLGLFSILRDNEALVDFKVVNSYFINIVSARKQK